MANFTAINVTVFYQNHNGTSENEGVYIIQCHLQD